MHRDQTRMKRSLQQKWKTQVDNMHKQRLSNIRPRIDTANPAQFSHLLRKRKREQILEGTSAVSRRPVRGNRQGEQSAAGKADKYYEVAKGLWWFEQVLEEFEQGDEEGGDEEDYWREPVAA